MSNWLHEISPNAKMEQFGHLFKKAGILSVDILREMETEKLEEKLKTDSFHQKT